MCGKGVRRGVQDGTIHFEEIHGMCRIHICHMPAYVHSATNGWSEWCRALLEVRDFLHDGDPGSNPGAPYRAKKELTKMHVLIRSVTPYSSCMCHRLSRLGPALNDLLAPHLGSVTIPVTHSFLKVSL